MQYQTPFRAIFFAVLFFLFTVPAQAIQILNMNVFDQLQGEWKKDFRATRIQKLSQWIHEQSPDIVVFQEAQGETEKSKDSSDAAWIKKMYSYRKYVHEMTGYDHFSYGYWMGAKHRPVKEFSDGFSFPGGVARKT